MMEEINSQPQNPVSYTEENIRHLSDMEHVRTRPGMYIGRLGDGCGFPYATMAGVFRWEVW